ncbi:MAG: hypothetical protein V3T11_10040 [Roseateles sp.]
MEKRSIFEDEFKLQEAMDATPVGHRDSLFGERAAGSRWGRAFTENDWETLLPLWQKFDPVEAARMAGCAYYEANIEALFPGATNGALPWGVLHASQQKHVREVDGAHGKELQLSAEHLSHSAASMATLIVGPDEGKQVVYTMHPGLPLAPYDGESRTFATAVKLT